VIRKKSFSLLSFTVAALLLILLAPATQACTYSPGYWKNHPDDITPRLPITIGDLELTTPEEVVAILNTKPRGDATYILARYLIALKLSIHDWNWISPRVQDYLDEADAWLTQYPLGSNPRGQDRKSITVLSEEIGDFIESRLVDD
jgi:hypothetical protein